MRIVGGAWRGRRLQAPTGWDTRPTSDRVRQTVFDIISHRFAPLPQDAQVLDLFAGTGALGLEALSRGARFATFVDHDRAACETIDSNIKHLKAETRCKVIRADASRFLHRGPVFDLVFADPPYGKDLLVPALEHMLAAHMLAPDALLVLESGRELQTDIPPGFSVLDQRHVGSTSVHFIGVS